MINTSEAINIGVVGIGHMGKYHVNLLTQIVPLESIFIFDIDCNAAQLVAEEHNINLCESFDDLLKHVNAVIIVAPTCFHYEYAMQALRIGCHVLVEKPISDNLEHTYEMTEFAEKNNLVLHIGHVERFNGAVQEIRNLISSPYYFQTQRIGSVSRIQDVGVVLDLMIHDIDIILSLVNSRVVEISAFGASVVTKFEDFAVASLFFENGVIASLTASRVSNYKARNMTVSQKDNYLYLDYASHDLLVYKNQATCYDVSRGQIKYKEEHLVDRIFVHKDNPLKTELEYFIDSIQNSERVEKYKSILWNTHSNYYTMEIAFQILEHIDANNRAIKSKKFL
ncbi:MAG: Gfo/Idh/MocA family protein [Brevinemataceae bacterium]